MFLYAKQVISVGLDRTGSKAVFQKSNVFVMGIVALASKRRVHKWTVPPGLVFVQTFSVRIMHSAANINKYVAFLKGCRHISLFNCSVKLRSRF